MDDPLSAVDVHVARHLFTHCVRGVLKYKTRVLCTHQIQFIDQADYVLLMDTGRLVRAGAALLSFFIHATVDATSFPVNPVKFSRRRRIYCR